VVKLQNRLAKFSCLTTSGEFLREGLEKKKKMRGLERESWGGIEKENRMGKAGSNKTLHARSCGEIEKSVGQREQ